jgi:hypothetical protein
MNGALNYTSNIIIHVNGDNPISDKQPQERG